MLGTPELIVIFLIVMLVFGGSRLSAVGRGLGQGVREFRNEMKGQPGVDSQDATADAKSAGDAAAHDAKNTRA